VKELPETRDSLLLKIRSSDNQEAWEQFAEIYRPVVYGLAISRGLQHADAMDLVQTVFVSIVNSISKWEKSNSRSRFRNWLLRVAKNATLNALTRRPPDRAKGGEVSPAGEEFGFDPEDRCLADLELEYRRQIFLRAAEEVQCKVSKESWAAFRLTAIERISIEDAAKEVGKSVGAVYATRSRIMKELTRIVSRMEESFQ